MPLLIFLKTGLRNRYSHSVFYLISLLCFFLASGVVYSVDTSDKSFFFINSEKRVILNLYPEDLNESRLKENILKGGKSEITVNFRFRTVHETLDVSLPETHEFQIRKTGYRDIITRDFVLKVNGREFGTYRNWDAFYRSFSVIHDFPVGKSLAIGESPNIRYKIEVVYKKFVAPLNLLYLIPGKYITRGRWIDLLSGSEM